MKIEIASVVVLSNEKGEIIPAMVMEFRENINGYFAMVKIGTDPNLVAIPIDKERKLSGYTNDINKYGIDYLVREIQPIGLLDA
jgi:hypothetical protein